MTLWQLKQLVLHQTGSDVDDVGVHLADYLNEGYDHLVMALFHRHVEEAGDYPPLRHDKSTPLLPPWAHRALADYASWMVCRNGPAPRQSRGYVFRKAFDEAVARARMQGGSRFRGIPN